MYKRPVLIGALLAVLVGAGGIGLAQDANLVTVTVIHTSDEHGWLEPFTPSGSTAIRGGAANIYSWWVEQEGYDPETFLLLSGGDNWTGPAISTWVQGASMVAAFNQMGYDAAAIGNHEFDFGREVMMERFAEAEYPYLSANIGYLETGAAVDFAEPYVILEANGVQVGVIGLTTTQTPTITSPDDTGDLLFISYAEVLNGLVPQMRDEGAEIVLVLAHVCPGELARLAREAGDLVDAMFAGHCHELSTREVDGIPILSSGENWSAYTRLTLVYDPAAGAVVATDYAMVNVAYGAGEANPVTPDAELTALVDHWRAETGAQLQREIGYTATGIAQRSPEMGNWVTDAWRWAFPADIAITNWGSFRQDLPAGPITVEDIVGLLPFENNLVLVEITAQELAENLHCCGGAVSGMVYSTSFGGVFMLLADGSDFDREATYRVLVNDFMYNGGDGYRFGEQDPDGYDTSLHWRQPVIDYTESLRTSPDDPLENYLDYEDRTH